MNGYAHLHFFNIEYWYCVIISLFGSKCTTTELALGGALPSGSVSVPSVSTTAPHAAIGFWDWLFGSLFGGGSAAAGGSGAGTFASGPLGILLGAVGAVLAGLWALVNFISFTLSFLLLFLIVGSVIGIFFIRLGEHERYGNLAPAAIETHPLRMQWQELLEDAMSADPKRWRQAIFGADEMLGTLFARLGYPGATTAERIKAVPEGAFANLPAAWEAHRIKNFVAAPASHFILTQREAFRVMKLYEQALREFDFI